MVLTLDQPSAAPEAALPAEKPSLAGLGREGLRAALAEAGVPEKHLRMRVNQLYSWLYVRGVADFEAMTDVAKELRAELSRALHAGAAADRHRAGVGRRHAQVAAAAALAGARRQGAGNRDRLHSGGRARHAVHIEPGRLHPQLHLLPYGHAAPRAQSHGAGDRRPDPPRPRPHRRLAGCGGQARATGALLPTPYDDRKITNIVLMGMGEPLYNFDNVKAAMELAADGEALSVSKRRITLSTSGIVPEIARWGAETGTSLAISLHAVRDELRDELVPINRKYPIAELLEACRNYPVLSNARRITFEYVMLKGVNDSLAEARELVRLLAGIPAKINLIPFNPWPGAPYECSDWEQIERFAEVVNKAGYASPVRTPRGRDIHAACGQLRSESVKQRASERAAAADAASSGGGA